MSTYKIVGGPSKHVLIDAFKYAHDKNAKIGLEFKVEICKGSYLTIEDFTIVAISHEDGSGESFNLSGSCSDFGRSIEFKAYYNSKHREGAITLKTET